MPSSLAMFFTSGEKNFSDAEKSCGVAGAAAKISAASTVFVTQLPKQELVYQRQPELELALLRQPQQQLAFGLNNGDGLTYLYQIVLTEEFLDEDARNFGWHFTIYLCL
jgi:hypothetical protein